MNASILVIATEVLSGETMDTNSDYLSKELHQAGVNVCLKVTVPDKEPDLKEAIDYCFKKSDFIITTGGLGPTSDDITKNVLCKYFNTKLVFNDEILLNIKELLKNRYNVLSDSHRLQAFIPEKCVVLPNRIGTASGMLFTKGNKTLISLPGVPFEMKWIFQHYVLSIIDTKSEIKVITRNIKTVGLAESIIAGQIKDIEENLPSTISLAYLPSVGQVKLRLTAKLDDMLVLKQLDNIVNKISKRLDEHIYGYDDISLEESIGKLLLEKGLTISTAESCTGGYLAHLITSVPGSSNYFLGGMVSYSNDYKIKILGVDDAVISNFGAVSAECAKSMAEAIRLKTNSSIAIATTGIAGPTGATKFKPVGTVYIAISTLEFLESISLVFDRGRFQNIHFFAISALNFLRKILIKLS